MPTDPVPELLARATELLEAEFASLPAFEPNHDSESVLRVLELTAKRLELLRELVPTIARVAVLVNPANVPNTESTLRDIDVAARAIGVQI